MWSCTRTFNQHNGVRIFLLRHAAATASWSPHSLANWGRFSLTPSSSSSSPDINLFQWDPLIGLPSHHSMDAGVVPLRQERGFRLEKLPKIRQTPETEPDLRPWLQLSLIAPPQNENPEVRRLLRKVNLTSQTPVSFHRDVPTVRGELLKACSPSPKRERGGEGEGERPDRDQRDD